MPPDFSKIISDTLARRAGSMCSNIECRVLTAGPTVAPDKSINIGEAAHIYGAREGATRYRADMTDISRAEITNGIWLCAKCHKLIDSDPARYPADLLFQWRALHDEFVISKLGTPNDKLRLTLQSSQAGQFSGDSQLARRIIRDRPIGWEFRLSAEFLRYFLKESLRRWNDLQRNLYLRPSQVVLRDAFIPWFQSKTDEARRIVAVLSALYTEELVQAWGKPGEPGDAAEIRHVCKLIQSAGEQLLQWEESVRFTSVLDEYEGMLACLPGLLGMQLEQLSAVVEKLDEIADWVDSNPHPIARKEFQHTIVFELPDGWAERVDAEIEKLASRR